MAIVIHKIKGRLYAYEHTRQGSKVVTRYLYPVDNEGNRRLYDKGERKPKEVKQQKSETEKDVEQLKDEVKHREEFEAEYRVPKKEKESIEYYKASPEHY